MTGKGSYHRACAPSTGEAPVFLVTDICSDGHEDIAQDLWAVAGNVASMAETGVDDAIVQVLVGCGMLGLVCERERREVNVVGLSVDTSGDMAMAELQPDGARYINSGRIRVEVRGRTS